MRAVLQDLRFALRIFRRNPGYVALAVTVLALGIGGTTAIFSVVRGVLWRPLPYQHYDRLVHIFEARPEQGPNQGVPASIPTFEDWKRESRLIEDFARVPSAPTVDFILAGDGPPRELYVNRMSADLIRLLGTQPILGRGFIAEDEQPGRDNVILLSHAFWRRELDGARDVLGLTLRFTRGPYTVIGVMPKAFEYPPIILSDPTLGQPDGWVPAVTDPASLGDRSKHGQMVYGRMKPGVSEDEALAEIVAIEQRIGRRHPETNKDWSARLISIHGRFHKYNRVKPMLLTLLAAVGFVLLIGCANVAGLMLARANARRRELAVRVALGAGRRRIASQLLVESLLLAAIGGGLGLLAAAFGFETFKQWLPPGMPRMDLVELDGDVLLFSLGVTLLTGLVVGVLPAMRVSRTDVFQAMKPGGGKAGRGRFGGALVTLEIAVSTVLLIGAGLTLRSFNAIASDDVGYRIENLLTARPVLEQDQYGDEAAARRFHEEVRRRVAALPGVEAVGWASRQPFRSAFFAADLWGRPFLMEGEQEAVEGQTTASQSASPGFFEAAGVAVKLGRSFTDADAAGTVPVAIVSEAMARRYWPGRTPVGERLKLGAPDSTAPWREIVGVSADVKLALGAEPVPQVYLPLSQVTQGDESALPTYWIIARAATLIVRTATPPENLADAVRREVWAVDADQPVELQTMTQLIRRAAAPQRFLAASTGAFSALALLLALVGVYGTLSQTVGGKTQEIGVRMALGAQRRQIFASVMRRAALQAAVGLAAGLVGALWLSRYLESQLRGVSRFDPTAYLAAAAAMMAVALLAAFVPAKRATDVEPTTALRQE